MLTKCAVEHALRPRRRRELATSLAGDLHTSKAWNAFEDRQATTTPSMAAPHTDLQKQHASASTLCAQYATPPCSSKVEHVFTPPPDHSTGRASSSHRVLRPVLVVDGNADVDAVVVRSLVVVKNVDTGAVTDVEVVVNDVLVQKQHASASALCAH